MVSVFHYIPISCLCFGGAKTTKGEDSESEQQGENEDRIYQSDAAIRG